jgi:hypothetical protein
MERFCNVENPIQKQELFNIILPQVLEDYTHNWNCSVNQESGRNGSGRNKLRL